jgi:hypothetical protein
MYRPLKLFLSSGIVLFTLGTLTGMRYLYFFFMGDGSGHIQSLILASILISMGVQLGMMGILADSISANRKINDEMLYRLKRLEYDKLDPNVGQEMNHIEKINYLLETAIAKDDEK